MGHKEQIKEMRKDVDALTLSATPIPRTLHMSMTGIRDMSVIETPPEQRYPVQTYVMEYSEALNASTYANVWSGMILEALGTKPAL